MPPDEKSNPPPHYHQQRQPTAAVYYCESGFNHSYEITSESTAFTTGEKSRHHKLLNQASTVTSSVKASREKRKGAKGKFVNTTSHLMDNKYRQVIGTCNVEKIGLESFIRTIVKELNLHLAKDDTVVFNMNNIGILNKWEDVFRVERGYTACLGISRRIYKCQSYIHDPSNRSVYFILEEFNERNVQSHWWFWNLPNFSFHVIVFCYYDLNQAVSKVDVQYDQLSFFLHCIGIMELHRMFVHKISTPLAYAWLKTFQSTGRVSPLTFVSQLVLVSVFIVVSCVTMTSSNYKWKNCTE